VHEPSLPSPFLPVGQEEQELPIAEELGGGGREIAIGVDGAALAEEVVGDGFTADEEVLLACDSETDERAVVVG
jgi:hypothetical protein